MKEQECTHEGCVCVVRGESYCSQHCRDQAAEGPGAVCNCRHPDCEAAKG